MYILGRAAGLHNKLAGANLATADQIIIGDSVVEVRHGDKAARFIREANQHLDETLKAFILRQGVMFGTEALLQLSEMVDLDLRYGPELTASDRGPHRTMTSPADWRLAYNSIERPGDEEG